MDTVKMQSGFRVNGIILVDNSFHRENHLESGEKVNVSMDIHTDVTVNDRQITVVEEVIVKQVVEEKVQVSISVKMAGMFECIGETRISDYDEFGRVNAAAIIFPYIREHVSSLSLKGGVGAIILPPVNFAALPKEAE